MISPNWPDTPCPNTLEWARRCCNELLRQDEMIPSRDAVDISDDMSCGEHWRRQEPEAAARELFGPLKIFTAW